MPRLIAIENGERLAATFSQSEINRRLGGVLDHAQENRLDAVLFTSYHNVNYHADFLYCAFGRSFGVLVTADNSTLISANIDGGQPWRRNPDNVVYTDWQRDNFIAAVQKLAAGAKRLGIEFDHVTLDMRSKLEAAFPGVELVDVARAAMQRRMVKSAEEIVVIKNGSRTADIGGAACVEAIAEGVPEFEVANHATQAMIREIAATYPEGELRDTWTWFQSGINTDGAHNPVTSRKLQRGDILSLNCFPMIAGYYTALERTLFLDHASDRHLELWNVNCEVHRRGLELIKPGVRCCDIALELNEIYRSHDLLDRRTFGYGHSFGVLSHYYGREAGLELREDIETVLQPGMVVSMEPMIMIPEGEAGAGGYREHDILVLSEDGADNITGFPFGPEKNIISG
ncbi:MAG: M24 family metallopeptidase [Alphaproteobacteria bacterium]|nr:M24 family metallopeptidase [Alphaproteobacteria bacterium]MBT5161033.1 M24 family metallopeptidase [Alphaproteobacteria bacterium]MBT5917408.1 M24 family metallopeptidase [Alphaproteobacteria bacterium]MBT6385995.1 M24 family metallopeptidase [Alphaproteobacteria bacterium]